MPGNCALLGLPGAQHLHGGNTENGTLEVIDAGLGIWNRIICGQRN